ncbi:unnamed protein product, partial [Vitis vinifera]|uniref:Tubby C-terminal domain-containing protein n=1 Tax=Vitis vinifera TaxID=29760 RepID=D7SJJ4_VITVI
MKRNRTNQTYHLYLGLIQASTDDGKFLLAAWNCRRLTCTDDIISLNAGDVWKGSTTYIGKLRYVYMLYEVVHGIYCFNFILFFLFLIVVIPLCSSTLFAERLIAFACVEGIFFSGSFCAIFWLKKKGLMPGLTFSNELISRYEGLHCDFACLLYSLLQKQLPWQKVHHIVHEAMEIETQFICEALPCALIGMKATLMSHYIKFVVDRLLVALGYERKYNVENPFDWMEFIFLQGNANFFQRRMGDYQKASIMSSLDGGKNYVFKIDEDF